MVGSFPCECHTSIVWLRRLRISVERSLIPQMPGLSSCMRNWTSLAVCGSGTVLLPLQNGSQVTQSRSWDHLLILGFDLNVCTPMPKPATLPSHHELPGQSRADCSNRSV